MAKYLGQEIHIVPLLRAQDLSATTNLPGVSLKQYHQVEFLLQLGVAAAADFTVTVEACTDSAGTSPTAISFLYRLSAVAGADAMGAVTGPVASLVLDNAAVNNKCLLIDVQGSELTAAKPYCHVVLTRAGSATLFAAAVALLMPRYPQESQISAIA